MQLFVPVADPIYQDGVCRDRIASSRKEHWMTMTLSVTWMSYDRCAHAAINAIEATAVEKRCCEAQVADSE